ncbi:TniQ family protein [Streptomyces sp. NPDC059402]|uniref:TniQ family protein n=1 Tax=Streptomyces sp. NPDC059402 TaxID=3346822 RepID=UPI00369A20ED
MTAPTRTHPTPAVRPAAMWPSPPGVLRVRPLPRETAASYLTRLAAAYHLSPAHLLDGLHITTTGTPAAPHTTELHYSCEAARRLAAFTRIPPAHLDRALTRRPPPAAIATAPTATAHWQPLAPAVQPLPACTTCTLRRPPHRAAPTAWIHPAPGQPRAMICTRHQQASSDPRQRVPLDIRALPELTHARRTPTATSLSWATTITTRWYDHHQHLHNRWHTRLHQLTAANPHLTHGPASPALTCRTLITYPETHTLATALDRLPLSSPLSHTQRTAFLHHLAGRLHLPRLAPADHDLLWQRLTTR